MKEIFQLTLSLITLLMISVLFYRFADYMGNKLKFAESFLWMVGKIKKMLVHHKLK